MKTLVGMAAAAALFGLPLAAAAQGRDGNDGYREAPPPAHAAVRADNQRGGGQMAARRGYDGGRAYAANRAAYRGYDASRGGGYDARAQVGLRGGEARGDARFRDGDDRRFRDRDRLRFGVGVAYGGYPYGYGGDYGDDGYAYSYPDDQGYYEPFAYDDGGYDQGGGYGYDQGGYDQGGGYAYDGDGDDRGGGYGQGYTQTRTYGDGNRGWSAGAPPADCGSWVWRERAQRYQWVAAQCPCPPDQRRW